MAGVIVWPCLLLAAPSPGAPRALTAVADNVAPSGLVPELERRAPASAASKQTPSAAGAAVAADVRSAPRHRRFTQAQSERYWTLADAEDPAAAAWAAQPKPSVAGVLLPPGHGRPGDLRFFAVNGSADASNASVIAAPLAVSHRRLRSHRALLASLVSFLVFCLFVGCGRRTVSGPAFRARTNVWSCTVAVCLTERGTTKQRLEEPLRADAADAPLPFWANALRLAGCGLGVFVTHLVWGFLQERIMTRPYAAAPFFFGSSNFLVLSNRLVGVVAAALLRIFLRPKPRAAAAYLPPYKYSFCAYANVVSSSCQYEMLKYVSFPAQVLSKSCKMLPVMMMSYIVSRKRHGVVDWLVALLVAAGATAFQLGAVEQQASAFEAQLTGLMLILAYIASDAFAAAWQAQLFRQSGVDIGTMMLWCNLFACVFTLAGFVVTLEFVEVWRFISANPSALADVLVISTASALGQVFLMLTIKYYGATVFAAIATLRQLGSILLSIALFSHHISALQIGAITLVFAALGAHCFYRWLKQRAEHRRAKNPDPDAPLIKP